MVDGEHMTRTETTAEIVDCEGKAHPPYCSSCKEAEDGDSTTQQRGYIVMLLQTHIKHSEERQQIGDDQHKIGQRKDKHR